jgi:hypothetical protein
LSSIFTEPLPPKPLDTRDALLERERRDVLAVHLASLGEALRDAYDALDHDAESVTRRGADAGPTVATTDRAGFDLPVLRARVEDVRLDPR